MKDNAVYAVVDERDVPVHRNIHSDAIILLTGPQAQSKCPHLLRRIVVWDAEHEREIVLLTRSPRLRGHDRRRHLQGAVAGALLQGAQAEPVKSFVGTTENALRIQIWTALLALLLVAGTTSRQRRVALQSCLHAAPQPLYLPSFARLA